MQRATRIPIAGVHSPVYHVSNTSSTLDLAASLLADTTTATPHLTTIIADRQSARARPPRAHVDNPGWTGPPRLHHRLPPHFISHRDARLARARVRTLGSRRTVPPPVAPRPHRFPEVAQRRARRRGTQNLRHPRPTRPGLVPVYDERDSRLRHQHRPGLRSPRDPAGHLPVRRGRRRGRRRSHLCLRHPACPDPYRTRLSHPRPRHAWKRARLRAG